MFNSYVRALKNYANFSGRAGRPEFWSFMLVNALLIWLFEWLMHFADQVTRVDRDSTGAALFALCAYASALAFIVAIVVPSISVTVRRLHDIGKSGWLVLILFVPFAGGIVLSVFCALRSHQPQTSYVSMFHASTEPSV